MSPRPCPCRQSCILPIRKREFILHLFKRLLLWLSMAPRKRENHHEEGCECKLLGVLIHEIRSLKHFLESAKGFEIKQIGGIMGAFSIVLGQIGEFTSVTAPVGGTLQPGTQPSWTSDDPNTSLTPSADGFSVAVATSATDTATSFNLTENGVNSVGAPISTSVNVALTQPAPPPPVPATGFTITQTS